MMDMTDVRKFESPVMRLARDIRAGAKMGPQAFCTFYVYSTGGTCALGAAALARGWMPSRANHLEFIGDVSGELRERVIYMNDRLRLTREQIADILELLLVDEEMAREHHRQEIRVPTVHQYVSSGHVQTLWLQAHDRCGAEGKAKAAPVECGELETT